MTGAPRRVLMTTDAVGGVWQYALELTRGLSRRGVRVALTVIGPPPTPGQQREAETAGAELRVPGLPLDWTTESEATVGEAARALAASEDAARADLVHLNHPAFALAAWPAPLLAVVHSCHGTWWGAVEGGAPMPADFRWRVARMQRALTRADAVITPTRAFADMLKQLYGPLPRVGVVYNARTPARAGAAVRGEEAPFVLTAGRLWDRGKNAALLDAAARSIAGPVVAAGPATGPNGEQFTPQTLTLCGPLDAPEMAARLRAAAVFVSPARYEPFGLAVLEAAQAARPLVLSAIPSFLELWEGAALFASPDRPQDFAAHCNRLLSDPAEAAARGAAAARRATRYGTDAMTDAYLQEYSALLGAGEKRLAG